MKIQSLSKIGVVACTAALLAGCASYPVSKDLREQAKPITPPEVLKHPGQYTGMIVIWGGRVIKTVNDTNGADIYVLDIPLDHHERPDRHSNSRGRFIAHTQQFVDPAIFKPGKAITVAGEISGTVTKPLQKIQYPYPVVQVRELHAWHRTPRIEYYPYPAWDWS